MLDDNSKQFRRRARQHEVLLEKLKDERGRRVVFLSHCLLNENVRYLGGAFRQGGVEEVIMGYLRQGVGIYQMPCPEQRAWGGVLKRDILPWYGSKGTLRYALARPLLSVFLWYTRQIYQRLAKQVVRDIEDYILSGFDVVGIVGIGGSPSCGVRRTLDVASRVAADIAQGPAGDRKLAISAYDFERSGRRTRRRLASAVTTVLVRRSGWLPAVTTIG